MSDLEKLKAHLAKDIPKEELRILEIASEHPYECSCKLCKKWWELVGEEND